ncbi:MAG: peptidoglycan DD-metalloendopeptidase family protein [Pseudomonadota bacterium]
MQRLSLLFVALIFFCPSNLNAKNADFSTLVEKENSLLADLKQLAAKIIRNRALLEDSKHYCEQLDYQIAESERRILSYSKRVTERSLHVKKLVRGLYKLSADGHWGAIPQDDKRIALWKRNRALARLVNRDATELALHKKELARLNQKKTKLGPQKEQRCNLHKHIEDEQAALVSPRKEKEKTFAHIRAARRQQEKAIGSLNQHQKQLLAKNRILEIGLSKIGGFAAKKGTLLPPVKGPIVARFEIAVDPRNNVKIARQGITYGVRKKAMVHAVAEGLLRFGKPVSGHGLVAMLDHGDNYYSVYGFMSSLLVKEGTHVQQNAALGIAGIDPATGESALYLEIRRKSRALDPQKWVQK